MFIKTNQRDQTLGEKNQSKQNKIRTNKEDITIDVDFISKLLENIYANSNRLKK